MTSSRERTVVDSLFREIQLLKPRMLERPGLVAMLRS